jgi:Arc/MetJ family transcription regulator
LDKEVQMRTNIVIDDRLMREALKASGLDTKRAVVEAGLRLLIQVKTQTGIRRLRGRVVWEGSPVAPVTTRIRRIPAEVPLGPAEGLSRACVVNLDTITTIPRGH